MAEEYGEVPEEPIDNQQEDDAAAKVAEKVGKMIKEIEKKKTEQTIDEEDGENGELGTPIYNIEADLLSAMLLQARLYEAAIAGRIGVSQAAAIIERELAAVTARLMHDLKKSKKKTSKRKKSSRSTRSGKKRKASKHSQAS